MKAMAMIALEKHRYHEVHVQARLTVTLPIVIALTRPNHPS